MKKSILIISAALIISGCASNEPRTDVRDLDLDNVVATNGEKLYCKRESVTGSHMKTTTCLTKAEKEAARRDSEAYVNDLKRMPEFKGESGG